MKAIKCEAVVVLDAAEIVAVAGGRTAQKDPAAVKSSIVKVFKKYSA